jgi:peroxiredoxin
MRRLLLALLLTIISITSFSGQAKAIAETNNLISPLLNGQQVPYVDTKDISGKDVNLSKIIKNKKTVLFFYRGGWCPFCNTQMGQLKAIEGQLKGLGFQLIGISTDSPEDLKKSIRDKKLGYQLFSDFNSTVSQAFGLAFFSSQKTTDRYLAKMHLANPLQKNAAGDERLVLPAPAIYVVDDKGLVQFSYVNPNYKVRLDETLLLLAAKLVK